MRRPTLAIAALLAAASGCQRANGAYCDAERPCGSGFTCDIVAHECQRLAGVGGDMAPPDLTAGCPQACGGTTPICAMPGCQSCTAQPDPEAACAALSSSTPHCLGSGACVGCRDAADCTDAAARFCDGTAHQCRGCSADDECPSKICELTPGAPKRGQCVDMSLIVYVDKNAAGGGDGLTPTTARQKISDGISQAAGMSPSRPFVRVAAANYDERVNVSGKTIYIVGAPGAFVHPTNNADALSVSNGGSLTVRGLTATASGNAGNCGNGSSFTAYQSQFLNSTQSGVYATGCQLLLDGCWVSGNSSGGINVGGNFTIMNTIITKNTGLGGLYQMANGTTITFVNNTVADNLSGLSHGGVYCQPGTSLSVTNSILYNNKGGAGTVSETNCATSFVAAEDASATVDLTTTPPGFKSTVPLSADSYRLTTTSVCIDKGTATGVPDHGFDFQPRPDARSHKVDIGADEVQQP